MKLFLLEEFIQISQNIVPSSNTYSFRQGVQDPNSTSELIWELDNILLPSFRYYHISRKRYIWDNFRKGQIRFVNNDVAYTKVTDFYYMFRSFIEFNKLNKYFKAVDNTHFPFKVILLYLWIMNLLPLVSMIYNISYLTQRNIYSSPENMLATAAIMKLMTTPGPATFFATIPATTYIPVPTQLPTPREVRSNVVRHFCNSLIQLGTTNDTWRSCGGFRFLIIPFEFGLFDLTNMAKLNKAFTIFITRWRKVRRNGKVCSAKKSMITIMLS